jgi:2-amino-4-hydroxy-6-hydroxymethyldihydropteridine diphosphokinase
VIEIPADAIVIGFGGNVGDRGAIVDRFVRAREALGKLGDVRSAALYQTAPLGPAQAAFLNTAVRLRAHDATAGELIETVLEIERLLGRVRDIETRWGPRPIDLDILVWGAHPLRWDGPPPLEVPHPRLTERRFALRPLIDLLGAQVVIPGSGATAGELEQRVKLQAVEQLAETW